MKTQQFDMRLDFDSDDMKRLGIQRAVDNAEMVSPGWSEVALNFVREYCSTHMIFSGEQIREFAESKGFHAPFSKRCWGGTLRKAANLGLIRKVGTTAVNNPLAHKALATLWQRSQ